MTGAIEPIDASDVDGVRVPPKRMTESPPRSRWIVVGAGAIWLLTLGMGLAILWVLFFTDYVAQASAANGYTQTADDMLIVRAFGIAFFAVIVGYASVGALLAGRAGAGRIAALLLAGGALFALFPFAYAIGGLLAIQDPGSPLFSLLLLLGPVAFGPAIATTLPGLAIAFPDGHLPSSRWRWPVGVVVGVLAVGTLLTLLSPGPVGGGPAGQSLNPLGIEALPAALVDIAYVAIIAGILGLTGLGVAAVVVRYRRGDTVERQQQRWFLGAVSVAAVPLVLSTLPGISGPAAALVAAIGLMLIPIAVGVAVARYRLYEIDHLINRTLVYVPLTAFLAGLYAATVALLQRVFQAVTGDTSDAAIIISTLILASVFTPVRKWLEGIVERRFKATASGIPAADAAAPATAGSDWDARMAAIALRVVRTELEARAAPAPPVA